MSEEARGLGRPLPGGRPLSSAAERVPSPPVQQWGVVVRNFSTLRQIPVEVDPERLLRAVRLLQPYREEPFALTLDEDGIGWEDRKGIRFHVHAAGGRTEIQVQTAKLTLFRRGRWRRWVGAAADRLEDLIRLLATEAESRG